MFGNEIKAVARSALVSSSTARGLWVACGRRGGSTVTRQLAAANEEAALSTNQRPRHDGIDLLN